MTITTPAPVVRGLRTRRSKWIRRLVAIVIYALVLVLAKWGGGELKAHRGKHILCPLLTSAVRSGRAVVTYADDTGDARMTAAIGQAVAAWNRSGADVLLRPSAGPAALTFHAAGTASGIPACHSTAARSVVVTFSRPQWQASSGPHVVLDPPASVAKVIGRALGLPAGGSCPDLMAAANCAVRQATPSAAEVAAVDRLYR